MATTSSPPTSKAARVNTRAHLTIEWPARWHNIFSVLLITVAALFSSTSSATDEVRYRTGFVPQPHLQAELLSEVIAIHPGVPFSIMLHLQPEQHWHTYWRNPGDSGLETRIRWDLPTGTQAGSIQWPTPQKIAVEHLVNYGYEGDTYLLSTLTPPSQLTAGDTFLINAQADWLVCEEICIPGTANFELNLPVVAADSSQQPLRAAELVEQFATARARLPEPVSWPAQIQVKDTTVKVSIQWPEHLSKPTSVELFPASTELVEHAKQQSTTWTTDSVLTIQQPRNTYFSGLADQSPAVLVAHTPGEVLSVELTLRADAAREGGIEPLVLPTQHSLHSWVLLSLLIGVVLNLLPSVLGLHAVRPPSSDFSSGPLPLGWQGVLLAALLSGGAVSWLLYLGLSDSGAHTLGWPIAYPLALGLCLYAIASTGFFQSFKIDNRAAGSQLKLPSTHGTLLVIIALPGLMPYLALLLERGQSSLAVLLLNSTLVLGSLTLTHLWTRDILQRKLWTQLSSMQRQRYQHASAFLFYLTAIGLAWLFGRLTHVEGLTMVLLGTILLAAAVRCWLSGAARHWQFGGSSALLIGALVCLQQSLTMFS